MRIGSSLPKLKNKLTDVSEEEKIRKSYTMGD